MLWEPDKETIQEDELKQLQLERLQSTLYRVGSHVPFYRKKFAELRFNHDDIRSLDDLRRLLDQAQLRIVRVNMKKLTHV